MKKLMQKLMETQTKLNAIKDENQKHYWATGENLKEYNRLYDEVKNIKKEVRNMKKDNLKNTNLINLEIASKNNSVKNTQRVINRGIEPMKHYHIIKNLYIAFYPSKSGSGKRYYKGGREITRETFLKNVGVEI